MAQPIARTATTTPVKKPLVKAVVSPALISGKPVEEIVWTALPGGIRKGKTASDKSYLKLSVFVAPRLRVSDTPIEPRLASFEDFVDWPARAKAIQFDVQFGSGPKVRATKVTPDPDSSLWTAIFKKTTKVESFNMSDYPERPILDYPTAHVVDYIKTKYQSIGCDPKTSVTLPTLAELAHDDVLGRVALAPHEAVVAAAGDISAIGSLNRMPDLRQKIATQLSTAKAFPHSPTADPEMDFARVVAMHEPFVTARIPITIPDLDFHSALSSLAKYPQIMKLLGLVVDLEIELTSTIPQSSTVRVVPDWGAIKSPAVSTNPRTAYLLTGSTFLAAPKQQDSDIENGMLKLDTDTFEVITLDVDGAAVKTMATANHAVAAIMGANIAKASEPSGLPALRTGGISLVRNGRAEKTYKAISAAYTMYALPNSGAESVLYADDLMRGFRVDVWDAKSGNWNSLCRRKGTYTFVETGKELEFDDEGFMSSAVAKAPEGSGSSDQTMRMHQSMFTWNGWSLCAPRPGKTITIKDEPGDVQNDPGTNFKLKTSFAAIKNSLPRLRYGNTYRLRARVVDLAGNSLDYDDPDPKDFSHATAQTVYGRFEPVASPTVVLRTDPKASTNHAGSGAGPAPKNPKTPSTVGSHATAVVNWGSPGESVERLVIRSFNKSPDEDSVVTKATTDRHIAPPKVAEQTAELHGVLDDTSGLSKANYSVIAKHDGYVEEVEPAENLDLPYLPDPLAIGASMVGLPGTKDAKTVEFYAGGKWPEAKPFRLMLSEGRGGPAQWDAATRVLTVFLQKAEVATFNLSSYLTEQHLEGAGIWRWLEEASAPAPTVAPKVAPIKPTLRIPKLNLAPSTAARSETAVAPLPMVVANNGLQRVSISKEALANLKAIAGLGRHWMITPHRTITLVHAVQQPLKQPQLTIQPNRFKNETGARLAGKIDIHGKSTSKVELVAEWDEPVDPLSEKKWRTISGHAHVFEKSTKAEQASADFLREWHEFHDTRYRKVRYHPVATTRFREYFAQSITDDPANISRTGSDVAVDILSSARPAAPKVLYVVPTFGWQDPKKEGDTTTRVRTGGGLRVYLDRPWFSSGEGELLGVVLVPQGGTANTPPLPPSEVFRPYVTMWGSDPIWDTHNLITTVPLAEQFTKAVDVGKNLSICDVPITEDVLGPKVAVAGHKVDYDEERQLWYCDIAINPQSAYYPFIRLALARYQPKSVSNAHLSRIVLAEFAQLVPDRTLIVTQKTATSLSVAVKGTGVYAGTWMGAQTSEVEASLEEHRQGSNDELAWTPVANSTVKLQPNQYSELTTTWVGQIDVPKAEPGKYRLVIKEYERYAVDKPFSHAETEAPSPSIMTHVGPSTDRRLVYADTLIVG